MIHKVTEYINLMYGSQHVIARIDQRIELINKYLSKKFEKLNGIIKTQKKIF